MPGRCYAVELNPWPPIFLLLFLFFGPYLINELMEPNTGKVISPKAQELVMRETGKGAPYFLSLASYK